MRVLVADTDEPERRRVCGFLETLAGPALSVCGSGDADEVCRRVADWTADVLLLDSDMQDSQGVKILYRIYSAETGLPPIPVIVTGREDDEGAMIDALRRGAQDYLLKRELSAASLRMAILKARESYEIRKSQSQAAAHMRQSQKMEAVGQLTSGVAHDFNNILTIILGNARLVQKRLLAAQGGGAFSLEDFQKKIESIDSAAKKGADLVRRLMVFARQRAAAEEVADLNERIRNIYELLRRTLGETIDIKVLLAGDLWRTQVDTALFESALINLAANARDAMPKGGTLAIETQNIFVDDEYVFRHPEMTTGAYVMMAVSDTGTGIPRHIVDRIFEPFFTTKKTGEGTGLGLSMVYGMLRQSGGHIHVYSEEGHGTVFRLYFLRYIENGEAEMIHTGEGRSGTETVLIVDDDEKVRSMGAIMLERLGYNVIQAPGGRTALEILKQENKKVDLLFTDVMMSGDIGGVDLAARVREHYPGIRILFTSGYTEKAMPSYNLVGDGAIIGKPYNKEKLGNKIREVLDDAAGL